MGYESKVFIVERNAQGNRVVALVVAEFDLCKVGDNAFFKAFKREIDYDLYLTGCDKDGNEVMVFTREDSYGEHMKSAEIGELIEALKKCEAREHSRRFPPVIAMLEAFDLSEWNAGSSRLEAVHYGH